MGRFVQTYLGMDRHGARVSPKLQSQRLKDAAALRQKRLVPDGEPVTTLTAESTVLRRR